VATTPASATRWTGSHAVRRTRRTAGCATTAAPDVVHPSPGWRWTCGRAAAEIKRDWTTGAADRLPVVYVEPAGPRRRRGDHQTSRAGRAGGGHPWCGCSQRPGGHPEPGGDRRRAQLHPGRRRRLKPVLDIPKLSDAVRPELVITEQPAKDASVSLTGGTPVVTPSVDATASTTRPPRRSGHRAEAPGEPRVSAHLRAQPAKPGPPRPSTRSASRARSALFSTGGFAADSGQTSKRAAENDHGKILKPGEDVPA